MAWWLEGAIAKHFWWVQNPAEAIFCIFLESGKNQKKKFPGKIGFFWRKIGFYRKNRRFFTDFFFSDFSTAKSFPGPPKSDFSPKNRPISTIFLSLLSIYIDTNNCTTYVKKKKSYTTLEIIQFIPCFFVSLINFKISAPQKL